MKIININSKYEITKAQQSFAEEIIYFGEFGEHDRFEDDSISILMEQIPIFLLAPENMPDEVEERSEKPATEYLGFYQHSYSIYGAEMPIIGLCPERIIKEVKNDEELTILIAIVIIHEFAHAKMKMCINANYQPIDEFYKWMEEPMANLITLIYFQHAERSYRHWYHRPQQLLLSTKYQTPIDYVKDFISMQPRNYRLGLELFQHRIWHWWKWRNCKAQIQKKTKEKQDWLDYVKNNVGHTTGTKLESLYEALVK